MDDIKKFLAQDTADKKMTARGFHHKVRGGGRHVRMPSDYMTKEEIKKLSSPVSEYKLLYPYKWGEFKKLPDRIQVCYWDTVTRNYTTNAHQMAKMFGVSDYTVKVWMKAHGIQPGQRGGYIDPRERDRWEEFLGKRNMVEPTEEKVPVAETVEGGVAPAVEEPTVVLPVAEDETPTESAPVEKTPAVEIPTEVLVETPAEEMNPHGIADLIAALIGTGAKLTIEVTL